MFITPWAEEEDEENGRNAVDDRPIDVQSAHVTLYLVPQLVRAVRVVAMQVALAGVQLEVDHAYLVQEHVLHDDGLMKGNF